MTSLSLVLSPERVEDAVAIGRLEARAFGPGRFARTAYRLREGSAHRLDLGVTASVGSFLVGSVRMSPVRAGDARFLMLGPLAVDPSFEGRGIGTALTQAAIEGARVAGEGLVMLVGDAPTTPASASPRCRRAASPCRDRSIRPGCCGSNSSRGLRRGSRGPSSGWWGERFLMKAG